MKTHGRNHWGNKEWHTLSVFTRWSQTEFFWRRHYWGEDEENDTRNAGFDWEEEAVTFNLPLMKGATP